MPNTTLTLIASGLLMAPWGALGVIWAHGAWRDLKALREAVRGAEGSLWGPWIPLGPLGLFEEMRDA